MKNWVMLCFVMSFVISCALFITAIAMFFSRVFGYGWLNLLYAALSGLLTYLLYINSKQPKATRNLK